MKQYSTQMKIKVDQVREATGPFMKSGSSFANEFSEIATAAKEMFFVVTLNQKHRIIDKHLISMGSLTASLVHPREVYRPAIMDSAAAVVFVHNHPSGDTTPSTEDRNLTKRLKDCGDLLGIRVLDHVIVGCNEFTSFVDQGIM